MGIELFSDGCTILSLQTWIDKFQTAKAALASASVAAAVAAQATLQEAYDKCARISLSFTLRVSYSLSNQETLLCDIFFSL